jgi:opacity protein-like surface antigen
MLRGRRRASRRLAAWEGLPVRPTSRLLCLALLGALLAAPASAGDYSRFGLYLGGGGSYGTDVFTDEIANSFNVPVDVDDTFGANARVGLRLFAPLALELQYEWLSEYDIEILGFDAFSLEQQALSANLKLYLPIWRVQPYLLAGVGFVHYELEDSVPGIDLSADDTVLAGRFGGGAEVYLTRHLALYGEGAVVLTAAEIDIDIPGVSDVKGLHYVSAQAGLIIRF